MKLEEKLGFIQGRLTKVETIINEVSNLLQFGYLETAVNRCYYGCFYYVQALLAKLDIYPKTHRGTISMFDLHDAKTEIFPATDAEFLHQIFAQRQLVDYANVHSINKAMVEEFLKNTKRFFEKTKDVLQPA